MSYSIIRSEYAKEHIYVVELDLDYCANTFSVNPCTATGSGDAKCFNTFESCQDRENYNKTTLTLRFCEPRSPHPIGIDAIPDLVSADIAPAKIDIEGGLGIRSSVTVTFKDHPHSDIGIDKYRDERTYDPFDRGTFWTKLRARNPNYQFRAMRLLSGYLVNGEFIEDNFLVRHYVIDKIDVSGGSATVTGKDPLKLAMNEKAQAPAPSNGQLNADITAGATSLQLKPSGVGSEYPSSGKILIRSEVIAFTRSGDNMTLTRAQNNTIAEEHTQDDTVQLCLEYAGKQVDFIVEDLLTNFANIDPAFIPDVVWQTEVDTYLNGLLTGIIVKPMDVNALLKELSEAMPHYLWWDEREQKIQLTALKAPPPSASTLNMDANFVGDTVTVKDEIKMRKSTIFVNFGQFDPTKNLDEPGNYKQTYARIDTDSIIKYGSNEIRTINSRWITNDNKAAALQLAALYGRRFADIPRSITFSLEAKDSDVWAGQSRSVNHRDITDFTGLPVDTVFQIISVKESQNFNYEALEFTYGEALPEDEGGGDPNVDLVIIPPDAFNINLRDIYNGLFPAPDSSTIVKFIVEAGNTVGSLENTIGLSPPDPDIPALDTGSWPNGAQVILVINIGAVVAGGGGVGASANGVSPAYDGGLGILLNHDLEVINDGIIGGGGGGGGRGPFLGTSSTNVGAAGGGGAGVLNGLSGGANIAKSFTTVVQDTPAQDGSNTAGGANGIITIEDGGELFTATGGDSGDLGEDGQAGQGGSAGGKAGLAVDQNGFSLIVTGIGDVRGPVINQAAFDALEFNDDFGIGEQ